jgi:hypothetical protein
MRMASRKLAAGPASTMKMRFHGGLRLEGARAFLGRHIRLALVEHLHESAERHGRDRPLGAVAAGAADPPAACRSPREAKDLHVHPARGEVVAELVDHDEDADGDEERQDGDDGAGHEAIRERGMRREM